VLGGCLEVGVSVACKKAVLGRPVWIHYEVLCWQWREIERLSDMPVQGFVMIEGEHRRHNHGQNEASHRPSPYQWHESLNSCYGRKKVKAFVSNDRVLVDSKIRWYVSRVYRRS
jgi:hypothetical protein